ncbi:DUF2087 domain-containing protein [Ornithinimicrobium cryptoxanthini]|uniref:DUF2087 domain-containing protein n=1 Tax=Ornithinimicrobium cryptoxanthini TaxID=2934161 RepID=A0ABY4YHG9_9MICO|nr:DUF2087 domain-containing protein [Ornithinimicrobium cryptoxanthini]USQ75597.1 DUF2087 domain-containing protein [Ornithinimicrobium cryptoxanthini]
MDLRPAQDPAPTSPRSPTPPPELRRLFNKAGQLVSMPVKPQLRLDLLTWIGSTLPADRELTETEINAHLRAIDDDVAMLRRYLVDHGLVERPVPGTYRVSTDPVHRN